MAPQTGETPNPPFAQQPLERLRARLLDLTARNRLLNFSHKGRGNIRFIDELPDQLHEMLLSEAELRFLAVPEPTHDELVAEGYIQVDQPRRQEIRLKPDPSAEEWAKVKGFHTSFELPSIEDLGAAPREHADKAIQTLFYPYEMEARLREIRGKAETAIEETGANILYVAFGFLRWFESLDSERPHDAPLLLVPVRLTKGVLNRTTGTYEYRISYTGEDILPNLSLREKLRVDFELHLPELNDGKTPEEFFSAVKQLIANPQNPQPRWTVCRHATLALFNFSKLLMYLDLNPDRWPIDAKITAHPIVRRFLEPTLTGDPSEPSFGAEYDIDALADVHHVYPLIEDADSSQHSALVDAIQGKDLVIEGPPGTGKSQTITNLIAAGLAQGKRILFVAEKLAALEVVKRRLDHAGLGDFCLELHSNKTQKRRVLDDIKNRLEKRGSYRNPAQIDAEIAHYESHKRELQGHAALINQQWKRTGKTLHEILMAATRYRTQLGIHPAELHPAGYDGQVFDPHVQLQTLGDVRTFGHVYGRVVEQLGEGSDLRSHPWFGVNNRDLQAFDADRLCSVLRNWQTALEVLAATAADARSLLDDSGNGGGPSGLSGLKSLIADLKRLPTLQGNEIISALPQLRGGNLTALDRKLDLYGEIEAETSRLASLVHSPVLDGPALTNKLRLAYQTLAGLGIAEQSDLAQVAKRLRQIEFLQADLAILAEPMAAVALHLEPACREVIQLSAAGLGEFLALATLVSRLNPALWSLRHERFDDDVLDRLLPELQKQLHELREVRDRLSAHFRLDQLPSLAELETMRSSLAAKGLFRWLNSEWRSARRALLGLAVHPGRDFSALATQVADLVSYIAKKRQLETDKRYQDLLGGCFAGMDTADADLVELRAWYKAVRKQYGLGFGRRAVLGESVLTMREKDIKAIRQLVDQGLRDQVEGVFRSLEEIKATFPRYAALQPKDALLVGVESPLVKLVSLLKEGVKTCQALLRDEAAPLATVKGMVDSLGKRAALIREWCEVDVDPAWFEGRVDLSVVPKTVGASALSAARDTAALARAIETNLQQAQLRDAVYRHPSVEFFSALKSLLTRLDGAWENQKAQFTALSALAQTDLESWQRGHGDVLDSLMDRNREALAKPAWLSNWLDYIRVRDRAASTGFSNLVSAVEAGRLPVGSITTGYHLGTMDWLAREILRENPRLDQFSGNAQTAIQQQFRESDGRLKQLQRERIACKIDQIEVPPGVRGGRVANYTDLALLQHECSLQRRHIPLRQLVRRASKALVALKPCFMMGPMSVAQYLEPGKISFDLVVIDEASQVKPEDALGAIARGRQVVVVGDPKQLPPTSFFDRVIMDEDEDTAAIEESESILDSALPMFATRRLKWHYRSKHESLIAFSNLAFYESSLVVFPAPHAKLDDYGVKFTRVPRGRFVNRRNAEEARLIAKAVESHLLHRPDDSLGVVAMSAEQRDQIERAVEDLAKENPSSFGKALEQNVDMKEPLFIKNLENVQGDERDVIFISCTYGPEEIGGNVFQRFGPINADLGWRRLNVLFTRAKKRMHVFSSMGSDDIVPSPQSNRGVKDLKAFLAFAETGHLHQAAGGARPPDSDFEIAVASTLGSAGFDCVPQVGVAGFFIDIAVRDPGSPGRYLMGIECDGASYHSGKSVRDRDRLRQTILEGLGWRIRRIWSTDWYKNPDAVIQPILRELGSLKTWAPHTSTLVPEVEEVEEIVEREVQEEHLVEQFEIAGVNLREQLRRFDKEVIRPAFPDTPENQRLLRPGMVEALLEFMPTTKTEFLEMIPPYVRQGTSIPEEKRFLDSVLRIIEEGEVPTTLAV